MFFSRMTPAEKAVLGGSEGQINCEHHQETSKVLTPNLTKSTLRTPSRPLSVLVKKKINNGVTHAKHFPTTVLTVLPHIALGGNANVHTEPPTALHFVVVDKDVMDNLQRLQPRQSYRIIRIVT